MFSSENRESRLAEFHVVTPMAAEKMFDLQKTHLAVTRAVQGRANAGVGTLP
jgi:hypothetical protein